jgi:hypothetical protein
VKNGDARNSRAAVRAINGNYSRPAVPVHQSAHGSLSDTVAKRGTSGYAMNLEE